MELPNILQNAINSLSNLPGIGDKSALRHVLSIAKWDKETIKNAITVSLKKNSDFEDSLQCYCAAANGCNTLITHDKTFYDCGIKIYSAEDFLERELRKSK